MGSPLTGTTFQVFQAGDLASEQAFADFLADAVTEEQTDQALALFETSLAVAQENHEGLEALLQGRRLAFNPQARREFSKHIAKWVRGKGGAIGRALEEMRRRFISRSQLTQYPGGGTHFVPPPLRGGGRGRVTSLAPSVGAQVFSSSPPKPKTVAARMESGAVRLMTGGSGMRLSLELRQSLELSQSLKLRQMLMLRMSPNVGGHFYESLFSSAKKLRVEIPELDLDFEVGLISRLDLPGLISLGSAGLTAYGYPFVVEDYFADLPEGQRDLFLKLVAVHEYGESIFGNHHLASLLELAVAGHWGVLEPYLEFYEKRYAAKFRDVALHRLRPALLKGLRKVGFKIPKGTEEEEWHPDPESSEALHAKALIERYPVPEAVRLRFESAVRDDMKISEEELKGWVAYVTVLEQIRSFYEKALQDVKEAFAQSSGDDAFRLRLALFRSLGVLQHEIAEGILDDKKLPEDLKDHLFAQFMERFRDLVDQTVPLLASDPILKADRKTFEKLAGLDAELWSALGLELLIIPPETWQKRKEIREGSKKLAEVREEQKKIRDLREAAWRYALSAGPALEDQQKGLEVYQKGVRDFETRVSWALNTTIGHHQKRWSLKKRPPYFFDRGEYLANFRARLWEDFQKDGVVKDFLREFPFMAGLINAKVNEAFPDLEFDVAQSPVVHQNLIESLFIENLAQLEYLTGLYPTAATATQGKIRKEMARLVSGMPEKVFHLIEEAEKAGLFSEALAVEIAREVLIKDVGFYATILLPDVDRLPYQLVGEEGDLEKVVQAYRAVFRRTVLKRGGDRLLQVLKTTPGFWKELKEISMEDITPMFELGRVYPAVLPIPSQALAGETPEGLWKKIDWEGERKEMAPLREALYSKQSDVDRFYPLQRYLKPYEFSSMLEETLKLEKLDNREALERLRAWCRWTLLRFLGGHDHNMPSLLDFEFAQIQLDLHAEWLRRGLAQRLSEKFGVAPEEVETRLPDFRVNLKELWRHHASLPETVRPTSLKIKTMYVRFLADMAGFAFSPFEEEATALARRWGDKLPEGDWSPYPEVVQAFQSVASLLRKEGYDRLGILSRQAREELVQRILNRAAVPVREQDYRKLGAHWETVIVELTTASDVKQAKDFLLELFRNVLRLDRELASNLWGRSHVTKEAIWMARQAWILLAIRDGEVFANVEHIFTHMPLDMVEGHTQHGFRAGIMRTGGMDTDPRRADFARQIRTHFKQFTQ